MVGAGATYVDARDDLVSLLSDALGVLPRRILLDECWEPRWRRALLHAAGEGQLTHVLGRPPVEFDEVADSPSGRAERAVAAFYEDIGEIEDWFWWEKRSKVGRNDA